MIVKLINRGDVGEYALDGCLDTNSSPEVEKLIVESCTKFSKIILNLERLEYISSNGLRVLKVVDGVTKKAGINFALTDVSPFVMEVLEITGFAQILQFE